MSAQLKGRLSFCLQKSASLLLLNSAFGTVTSEASYGRCISIHFSMNFHRNTEKTPVVPMKVSSDSELVKQEVLVRMVWNKWSKGLETWLLLWSPSLYRCVFIRNVDSPVLPTLVCLLNEPFILWNRPCSKLADVFSSRLPSHHPCFLWSGRERELNRLLVLVGTAHGHAAWESTQHSDWLLGAVFANLIHAL